MLRGIERPFPERSKVDNYTVFFFLYMGGKELCELKVSVSKLRQDACERVNKHDLLEITIKVLTIRPQIFWRGFKRDRNLNFF